MHEEKPKEVCHICAKEFRCLKTHIMYAHNGGNITLNDKPCPEPGCKRMFRLETSYEHQILLKLASIHFLLRNEAAIKAHFDAVHLHKKSQCPQCQVNIKMNSVKLCTYVQFYYSGLVQERINAHQSNSHKR